MTYIRIILIIVFSVITTITQNVRAQEVVPNPLIAETEVRFSRLKNLLEPGSTDVSLCKAYRDGLFDTQDNFVGYGVYGMRSTLRYPYGITEKFSKRKKTERETTVIRNRDSYSYEKTNSKSSIRQVTISSFPPTLDTIKEWRDDVDFVKENWTATYNNKNEIAADKIEFPNSTIIRAFEPQLPTCKEGTWVYNVMLLPESDSFDGLYKKLVIDVSTEAGFWRTITYLQDNSKNNLKGRIVGEAYYAYDKNIGLMNYHIIGEEYEEVFFNTLINKK